MSDYRKEFEKNANNNFGSFTPKNEPKADKSGAKQPSSTASKQSNPVSEVKQAAGKVNPVNDVKNSVKADINAGVTGDDPDKLKEQYENKDASAANVASKALKSKVAKGAGIKGAKGIGGKLAMSSAKAGIGSKFTGALSAVKSFGANVLAGAKGVATAAAAGAAKAGAVVGGALHIGATAGTVLVISGTLIATSLPVVGGVSYMTNSFTQKTDGCTPEEYDQPTVSGAEGAVEWARMIAEDNTFTYGEGQTAHAGGCYFCGTNTGPNAYKKGKDKRYEKTWCCNPFTISAYAHGSGDEDILKLCEDGGNAGLCWDTPEEKWNEYHFELIGKPPMSQLKDGDIGFWDGHQWMVESVKDGNVVDASGGGFTDDSISIKEGKLASYYNGSSGFARYVGSGSGAVLPLFRNSSYNSDVADMTADDGCGGEMDGANNLGAYVGAGMKKMKAANGEEYVILDFDLQQVIKVGHQGPQQCYQYSIAYADLIMGGKYRCAANGEAFRTAYGDGGKNGDPTKVGGNSFNLSGESNAVKTCIEEIKKGRPVIVHVAGNSYNVETSGHFVCVVGWTAKAGSSPSWDELVCVDPSYFYADNADGLHALKGFNYIGDVTTFENWTPAKGQKKRK